LFGFNSSAQEKKLIPSDLEHGACYQALKSGSGKWTVTERGLVDGLHRGKKVFYEVWASKGDAIGLTKNIILLRADTAYIDSLDFCIYAEGLGFKEDAVTFYKLNRKKKTWEDDNVARIGSAPSLLVQPIVYGTYGQQKFSDFNKAGSAQKLYFSNDTLVLEYLTDSYDYRQTDLKRAKYVFNGNRFDAGEQRLLKVEGKFTLGDDGELVNGHGYASKVVKYADPSDPLVKHIYFKAGTDSILMVTNDMHTITTHAAVSFVSVDATEPMEVLTEYNIRTLDADGNNVEDTHWFLYSVEGQKKIDDFVAAHKVTKTGADKAAKEEVVCDCRAEISFPGNNTIVTASPDVSGSDSKSARCKSAIKAGVYKVQ
jgi:hypothetical protein